MDEQNAPFAPFTPTSPQSTRRLTTPVGADHEEMPI
jgi:hypothetical protein